jgi:hypothetical protein
MRNASGESVAEIISILNYSTTIEAAYPDAHRKGHEHA